MSHLSDGDLHAWLDGGIAETSDEAEPLQAHLDTCPECAARLEEARELVAESRGVLASAVPRESAPPFEEIRREALTGLPGRGANTGFRSKRGPWLSPHRFGWAATVALAVGAGWIGRAVLEEKGWTDPFHEGPSAVASRVPDAETDADEPLEYFASEQEALEEKAGMVGGKADDRTSPNEVAPEREADLKDGDAPSNEIGVGRKRELEDPASQDEPSAIPPRAGALAQAEGARTEEATARELVAADELAAAPEESDRQDARAKSVQPKLDPWHALPSHRLTPPTVSAAGCYRLEFSWSPGVAYLPGSVRLDTAEAEGRSGQSVFQVLTQTGSQPDLYEGIWASPHPDSVWVQLVSREDRDALTVRAGRSGPDWTGEGRVLRPGGPVSVGQTRGAVHLVSIGCQAS